MRVEAVCFTRRGQELGKGLVEKLACSDVSLHLTRCGGEGPSVHTWAAEHFATADAMLFIGAAGIAVRAIATHVASKTSDPAVLVVDEYGHHVIPLLSGHIGGANALARQLAHVLCAEAVITTATDLSGFFAVDTWATENGYHIQNPARIKTISARLLAGDVVTVESDYTLEDDLPVGLEYAKEKSAPDIEISVYNGEKLPQTLWLTPPALVLGVGCSRDTAAETVEAAFSNLCASENIHPAAFGFVCSIDLKKDELGLATFCKKHGWPLRTFSAEELAGASGSFTASAFVEETTGVDNVCERSAVLGSGGTLLVKKTAGDGVTLAVAQQDWTIQFEEDA